MIRFLRSQSQTVLVIVLGVIGLGFLFYGNSGNLLTNSGAHIISDYGRIDGTDLSIADLYGAVRTTRDTFIIQGQGQQLAQAGTAYLADEAWRELLLLHEADRLHIQISEKELADYVRSQHVFQKDGVYDPETFKNWLTRVQMMLRIQPDAGPDPLAHTEEVVKTIMTNTLRIKAVKAALFSTVRSSDSKISSEYEKRNGPAEVSFVTFDEKSLAAKVEVTPDEIAAEYKAHPENPAYRTKEKRKVDYILLQLTPEEIKLPDDQKKTALEKLGEKANEFVQALIPEPAVPGATQTPPPDFMAEATKRGLKPNTTDFFAADTTPANVPPSPSFNSAASALTKDSPVSPVVDLTNGVAVLHLVAIQASDLLPLDQVKAQITTKLHEGKTRQMEEITAQLMAQTLKSGVEKGGDFKAAAANLKLKVETLPTFVPLKVVQDEKSDQRTKTIAYESTTLEPGQVSTPIPIDSDKSIVILHLDARAVADPTGLAEFATRYREGQDEQLRETAYADWAEWMSKQPGTHKPPDLELYGQVQD